MNRLATRLLGPEIPLAALTALIFWFGAGHNSGEGRDLEWAERFVMLLPFVATPLAFLTFLFPAMQSWWGVLRINAALALALALGAVRLIEAFGTGAKGQDAALALVVGFGVILASLGNAVVGAAVLAKRRPAFAEWFRRRPVWGTILTAAAGVPLGMALALAVCFALGMAAGVWALVAALMD